MYLFSTFLCLSFLIFCKCQNWVIDDEGCRTPEGGVGNCVPVRQCRPMIQALQGIRRPVSNAVKQQINRYICSYKNNVNICCPSGPIILEMESRLSDVPRPPPDVSNHRNIGLLPTECGYLSTDNKIRGGDDAELNEFPWMALLSYRTTRGPEFKCGGSIINDRYILTAAHCIKNTKNLLLGIRVGEYNIGTRTDCVTQNNGVKKCTVGIQDLGIEKIIPHPQYNETLILNDIGLVRVTRMNLNYENARPVCLPLGETKDDDLKNVIVTGWGVTNVVTKATSQILQKINLPVVDLETCRSVYRNQRTPITYRQICAGGKIKKDSCSGDSGGPLHSGGYIHDAARMIQHGIVSFGPEECGQESVPGVYTRVAYYMDWILDNLEP